jgi:hypothetical protein
MKKLLSLLTALTLVVVCLVGCNKESSHFTGEWKFAEITKVEFSPEIDDYTLDALKQIYSAEDEETLVQTTVIAIEKYGMRSIQELYSLQYSNNTGLV